MELYKIDSAILKILDDGIVIDEETGEVLFDSDNFDELIVDRNTKWESIGLYIKNLTADAVQIKAEEKALYDRRKIHERKAERLKQYLLHSMELVGDRKFETSKLAVNLRKTSSVVVDDLSKIPQKYIKKKEEISADKAAIKKAISSGEEIDGARIIEKNSIGVK